VGVSERIGRGAWARRLASTIVPNEASTTAEHARALLRDRRVRELEAARGAITAVVAVNEARSYEVALRARPVQPRAWAGVLEAATRDPALQAAVDGREQSIHLLHELAAEWGEPLVPRGDFLRVTCSCSGGEPRDPDNPCRHVAAVAYAAAEAVDADPAFLLRWRGCDPATVEAAAQAPAVADLDPWQPVAPLPEPRGRRPLPAGSVLMRLGPSGVNVGGRDLVDVLRRAYDRFGGD
jgi:uncharacterized Zn finger protein